MHLICISLKKNTKVNKKYIKKEPWMTEGLLTSMRNKSKLFNIKVNRPTEANINKFKAFVNKYNRLKREMKKIYYKNILELNKFNMKNTWRTLKQVLGKERNKSIFPQSFQIDDTNVTDKNVIAESFNKYFSEIGKQTSQNVPKSKKKFSEYLKTPNINSIFLEPINSSHVLEIVQKLKPKTSFGHDEIPTKIIKETIVHILEPLTHILNRSLDTGIIPSELKIAKVIPIYKASNNNLLKNYRPISLLPAFSKLFEKVMFIKIMSFLSSQNILYKHQYGFRPKHQTIHPIIHLLNQCAEVSNKQRKQFTLSIFCDLSKAFDVINHDILIYKLEYYGIRGLAKNWILNYLSNRKQYVQYDNHISDSCSINCGVPQGSILGPLLYLIYVNDISASTEGKLLSFADDTSLFLSAEDINTLFQIANFEINNLYDWFCANKLSLNAKKTKYIVIRPPYLKCDLVNLYIKINGVCLDQIGKHTNEHSIKFLGVHIDEHLSWKNHLNHINNKISRSLFMLKQVKYLLPTETLKTLYFAMIHPHLVYGILAWGNANKTELNRTILLQKRAIRLINRASYNSHTEPLFKISNILKLNDLYKYEVILFMHSYVMGTLPQSFSNIFKYNHEGQGTLLTRQSNLLHIERCDSKFSCRLPFYNFPILWNQWFTSILNVRLTKSQTKKSLKTNMINTYACTVKCLNPRCKDCLN